MSSVFPDSEKVTEARKRYLAAIEAQRKADLEVERSHWALLAAIEEGQQ